MARWMEAMDASSITNSARATTANETPTAIRAKNRPRRTGEQGADGPETLVRPKRQAGRRKQVNTDTIEQRPCLVRPRSSATRPEGKKFNQRLTTRALHAFRTARRNRHLPTMKPKSAGKDSYRAHFAPRPSTPRVSPITKRCLRPRSVSSAKRAFAAPTDPRLGRRVQTPRHRVRPIVFPS